LQRINTPAPTFRAAAMSGFSRWFNFRSWRCAAAATLLARGGFSLDHLISQKGGDFVIAERVATISIPASLAHSISASTSVTRQGYRGGRRLEDH